VNNKTRNPVRFWAPPMPAVAVFAVGYLVIASVAAVMTRNFEFVFYIASMIVIIAAIAWGHSRIGFGPGVLWCLAAWGFLHMVGGLAPVPASWPIHGNIRVLYSWWLIPDVLKYDHVVHAFGFGATTGACWQGLRRIAGHELRPSFGTLLLCVMAAQGFGALNEMIEFAATLTLPETNVGGYRNTGWDLVSNLAGAIIAALLIRLSAHALHRTERIC